MSGVKKHGLTKHPLFNVWCRMKKKCNNPNYHRYEKDLTYYNEWEEFQPFYDWAIQHWKKGFIFERKDLLTGFYPDNCEFVSASNARKKYEH